MISGRARLSLVTLVALGLLSLDGGEASAQAKPPPPPAAPVAPAAAPRTSSLAQVVAELTRALGPVPAGALVATSSITTDVPAPRADELALRLGAQLAGRLGPARAHTQPVSLPVARSLSGRAASLVYVQLEIVKGELRATADLYPVVSNGWERLRNPVPGPRAHAFASAPLDAEIRGFLAPVVLEQASVHKAKHDEGDVLAIGCGDVDGDGGLELVTVTKARVSIGRLRGGKLVVHKSAPWSSLASRTPVPMRDPLAAVLVSPVPHRGEIFVGTTDRGGVATDANLVTRRALTGIPVAGLDGDACAIANGETSAFDGNAVTCTVPTKGDPSVVLSALTPKYDAIAALSLVGKDGSVSEVVASRETNGKLHLRRSEPGSAPATELTVDGAGAQVALVDLDLDGVAEVVTTADGFGDDTLTISSFAKGKLTPRLRVPAKEGVRALAVCPPEERGIPALVAVVGSEVWLVR